MSNYRPCPWTPGQKLGLKGLCECTFRSVLPSGEVLGVVPQRGWCDHGSIGHFSPKTPWKSRPQTNIYKDCLMRLPQGPGHGLCVSAPPGSLQVPTLVSLTPSSHRPQTQPLSPRSTYCRRTGQRDADEASLSEEVVAPAWRELVWFQGRMFRVNTSQADQDHRCGTGAPEQFLGGLS